MNMRRKNPMQGATGGTGGGYVNNQHKKPRFVPNGEGRPNQGYNQHNNNRPRKNYSAMREKYLAQARDALAGGDRVLAENYFQHADHCYRMMMEEGQQQQQRNQRYAQQQSEQPAQPQEEQSSADLDAQAASTASALPAFLTVNYEHGGESAAPAEPVPHWEE